MNAEDAFSPTRERTHFFASTVAEVVLSQLQQGLDHERPVILLTGEAGVGKSSVVREACARWGARVRAEWLALPAAAPDALLEPIVRLFGGKARGDDTRPGWLAALSRVLGILGEHDELPLLIVEQAETLSIEALVELAAIHGEATIAKRALRIILLGTPALETRLDDIAADPLVQLIGVRARLAPLPPQDVRHYLHHRVAAKGGDGERVFSRKAARELHSASAGVPGELDLLAAESIRSARKSGTTIVGQEHVRAALTALKRVTPEAVVALAVKPAPVVAAKPVEKPAPKPAPAPKPVVAKAVPPPPPAPPVAPPPLAPPPPVPEPVAEAPAPPAPEPPALVVPPLPKKLPPTSPPPPVPPPSSGRIRRPVPKGPTAHRPLAEPSPLDSRHPRVKEWVSRFTEGETPSRFGARLNLPPITDPDSLPTFETSEPEAEAIRKPERKSPRDSEAMARPPAARIKEKPAAFTPEPVAPAPIDIVPEPIVLPPEPIVLGPDAVSPVKAPAKPASGESKENRKKRRQRERDAAAAARSAARVVAHAPPPSPPEPVLTPVEQPVATRKSAPVIRELPVPEELEPVMPARMLTGPRANAPGRFMHVFVPGLLMLGVAGVAIWAGTRGGFEKEQPSAPTQLSSSRPVAPTPAPVAPVPQAADSEPPAVEEQQAPAETVVVPPVVEAAPAKYCLAVGSYLFSDRARIVSHQLSKRTGLDSWVQVVEADGARNYKILLGGFPTQDTAEKLADTLLSRGIVSEALVTPLPKERRGH